MINLEALRELKGHPVWVTLKEECEANDDLSAPDTHGILGIEEEALEEWCMEEALSDLEIVTGIPPEFVALTMMQIHAGKVHGMVATGYHMGILTGLLLAKTREEE